jgi:hypothetical protein
MGNQRAVGTGIVCDLQAALDHGHGALAVGQNGHDLGLVHQLGSRHADMHVDDHRIRWLAERGRDRQRIVPERIAERPAGGLGRVRAADVGPHADLENHALSCHRLTPEWSSRLDCGHPGALDPGTRIRCRPDDGHHR